MMNKLQKKWYVDNHELYSSLDSDTRKLLVKHMEIHDFKPGQTVFTKNEPVTHLLIIKHGDLFLYHKKNKKRIIFDTLTPGDLTGSVSPEKEKTSHFAQAGHGGVCFCAFPKELFWNIAKSNPKMLMSINSYLVKKFSEYKRQFENLQSKADELIFHELQRLKIQRQKGFIGKFINRPLRVTHEEIAERTGLNRVTVTRAMKKLKIEKKIAIDTKTGIIEIEHSI